MSHAIKTFGQPRTPGVLGDPTPTALPAANCGYASYLGDTNGTFGAAHWVEDSAMGLALVGVGFLIGGLVPIVGRTVGVAAGAGFAGATTYARFLRWKTAGGTAHTPGSCT
jgi:hypothetical protein